ncbi:bifunctional acetate--CoA ligase family protein/GNAT family N-acetyltransferase [Kaustia mangrovi]|uniref:Bifunctional acetate--CoA ligase family protein/GNAT family N-acetyltransferase n=1 Tax=Kaustia mangrovi TaxID=2593653 RepID=A0A7S8C3D0_9HYPH|nr:bifunctional acetate--CoA ligase family protein/GNAT family N-acetyltransferase [Kaustia mangrovi]QPC42640.1 bifunctional acetate--CoA ligase family protein/GNAT family N-acetyltransferase [Kaustia mangrovi]
MSIRNFDALFKPKTIALIGASNRARSVGSVLARNLFEGGFEGAVLPVNPKEEAIHSVRNFRSIAELPETPDLAIIATPPATVPGVVKELGERGCRAAVVITAGFGEGERAEGRALRQEMLNAARPHLMRILGPNCLGIMSPHKGINATFAHVGAKPGDIAFLSQSGAVAIAVLDWARSRGIGFSHLVSLGDKSDVDFGDLLDYLALDPQTRSIVLYVESIAHARKFMSAARMASRTKPVVVVKVGRSAAGAKAALSHTGALAGADAVYDAAFARAGLLRVKELGELFEAIAILGAGLKPRGEDLTIVTNGGGVGVLAADMAAEQGIDLPALTEEEVERLNAVLPDAWSRGNPVDILGDAPGARYTAALEGLVGSHRKGALLVLNCPTAVADSREAGQAVVETLKEHPDVAAITAWLGDGAAADARRTFAAHNIPTFETPEEAVRAYSHLVHYRRNQALLMETPDERASTRPDLEAARKIVSDVLGEGRDTLNEPEAKALLRAYGISTVATHIVASPQEAEEAARAIGAPVALKILSPDITHKSDVGGVALDLETPEAVGEQARHMLKVVAGNSPQARLTGFTVQEMVRRPGAVELIAGLASDPVFGPIVLFGQGGTAVEVIGDRAIGFPPLNSVLASDMIARTRISRLLAGYRDRPAADRAAIEHTLIRLADLAADLPEVVELDINPLLADEKGVVALDARVVVKAPEREGTRRFAIAPYPHDLARTIATRGGTDYLLRPVRPEDEARAVEMLKRCSLEDIRMRFFASIGVFTHAFAARMTQIDYDREMVFVAQPVGADGEPADEICGIARLAADPDNEAAEYAIIVRSDLKGQGLGYAMMSELLAYARKKGIASVFGDILKSNRAMLQMTHELGFTRTAESAEDGIVTMSVTV